MKKIFLSLVGVSLGAVAWAAPPSAADPIWSIQAEPSQGTVEFLAIGRPSALKIRGTAAGAEGTFKVEGGRVVGDAKFRLEGLDTGIAMRTQHMKEKYLEIGKFPESRLTIRKLELPSEIANGDGKAEGIPFEGALALHGVEKPVQGKVGLSRKEGKLFVEAAFTLRIGDFGISKPGYAGITMAEDVDVKVKFSAPIRAEKP